MADLDFYYPFDSVSGDRKTTAATERRFFDALYSDGVVGAGGFAISETNAGVYSIAPGVAIIGGAIGGITSAKSITAQPAAGASLYIALRLDTTSAVRKITLEATATLKTATAAQLDSGAQLDLALYKVEGQSGGGYGLLDERSYCTSFDAQVYQAEADAAIDQATATATAAMNAQVALLAAQVSAATAQTQGLYGGMARQGFMNPTFAVNQRGEASYSITSGAAYTYDRWKAIVERAALASAMTLETVQDGERHALKIGAKAFASSVTIGRAGIVQNIEGGVRTFAAGNKKFTVSFDAKANTACKLGVDANQIAETGGAGTFGAQTISIGTSWQRYSVTFTGSVTPTAEQLQDVLQVGFFVSFVGYGRYSSDQSTANNVYLANMQINEGEEALPCYCPALGEDERACMRYYQRKGAVTLSCGSKLTAAKQVISSPLPLPVKMRTTPTVTAYDRAGMKGFATVQDVANNFRNGLSFVLSSESPENPVFAVTDTVAGECARVAFSRIDLDAELQD